MVGKQMKKKALRKDFYMEIRRSMGRFLSIFFIVAIGCAFFSGIRSSDAGPLCASYRGSGSVSRRSDLPADRKFPGDGTPERICGLCPDEGAEPEPYRVYPRFEKCVSSGSALSGTGYGISAYRELCGGEHF